MKDFNVKFGIIGIDHRHVYTQAQFLIELGAELVGWCTEGSPTTLAGFTKRFPKARRFADPRSLLEDPDIQVILTSAIPSERAKISISAMKHGIFAVLLCNAAAILDNKNVADVEKEHACLDVRLPVFRVPLHLQKKEFPYVCKKGTLHCHVPFLQK